MPAGVKMFLLTVVAVLLAAGALHDEAEDDVTGVRVALRGAGREAERLAGEERQEVGELAQPRGRRGVVPRAEDVAEARAMLEELAEGDLVGARNGRAREMHGDGVVEGQLAGGGELLDRHLGEVLADRADVEHGLGRVGRLRLFRAKP
jgi:hypothetical protein